MLCCLITFFLWPLNLKFFVERKQFPIYFIKHKRDWNYSLEFSLSSSLLTIEWNGFKVLYANIIKKLNYLKEILNHVGSNFERKLLQGNALERKKCIWKALITIALLISSHIFFRMSSKYFFLLFVWRQNTFSHLLLP